VEIPGLEREVQRNQHQMHKCDPFPSPTPRKYCNIVFFAWCDVGVCRARCCALSLARHQEGLGRAIPPELLVKAVHMYGDSARDCSGSGESGIVEE
jgi:hypothetical protein